MSSWLSLFSLVSWVLLVCINVHVGLISIDSVLLDLFPLTLCTCNNFYCFAVDHGMGVLHVGS